SQPARDPLGRSLEGRDALWNRALEGAPVQPGQHAGATTDPGGVDRQALGRLRDAGALGREPVGCVAVQVEPRVPGVDVREGGAQDAVAAAADHQRRSPHGTRQQHGVPSAPEPSLERDPLAREQPSDDRERFLEPRGAVVERHPERPELRLVPPGPHAEDETTAAHLVDGRGHLRDQSRRMETEARDERSELDPLGRGGERREQRPRLPRPTLGATVAPVQQVVAEPDGVEPRALGGARHRQVLGPADVALHLRELDPDPKRSCHARSLVSWRPRSPIASYRPASVTPASLTGSSSWAFGMLKTNPSRPASRYARACSRTASGSPTTVYRRYSSRSVPRRSAAARATRSASRAVGAITRPPSRVLVIVEGSRPTSSQWRASTSSLCRIVGTSPNRLQASAYWATNRRVRRSPPPPTRIGMPPGRIGRGTLSASRAR